MPKYVIETYETFYGGFQKKEKELFDIAFASKDVTIGGVKPDCDVPKWMPSRAEWWCGNINLDNKKIYFTTNEPVKIEESYGRYPNLLIREVTSGGKSRRKTKRRKTNRRKTNRRKTNRRKRK